MPEGLMSTFGWLMGCCVSDCARRASRDALSAALVFALGIAASEATLYAAGLAHII